MNSFCTKMGRGVFCLCLFLFSGATFAQHLSLAEINSELQKIDWSQKFKGYVPGHYLNKSCTAMWTVGQEFSSENSRESCRQCKANKPVGSICLVSCFSLSYRATLWVTLPNGTWTTMDGEDDLSPVQAILNAIQKNIAAHGGNIDRGIETVGNTDSVQSLQFLQNYVKITPRQIIGTDLSCGF